MRHRLALASLIAGAGCSLFVDTGGFEGEPPGPSNPDASSSTTDGSTPSNDDASTSSDATVVEDSSSDSATDAGFDVMSALVGDWPLDEGSGTIVNDKSGHSHNGVIFGGTWVADGKSSPASALAFSDAGTGYVSVAGDPDFSRPSTPAFSMMAWARVDESPSHDMFFSISFGSQDSSYGIEILNATTLTYWDGKDHVAQATIPNVVGAWHHFGVVVEGAQARIYFDGVRISQAPADTTPLTATQVFLGRSSFVGDFLYGAVDKARYFRVALTDAQMMAEKNR